MKSDKKRAEFYIDKNIIGPDTINTFSNQLKNIDKIRGKIFKYILNYIYKNLDFNKRIQTIDITIYLEKSYKTDEPFMFKEFIVFEYLNKLKRDKKCIKNFSFINQVKTVSFAETIVGKIKKIEPIDLSVTVEPKKFSNFFESNYGRKIFSERSAPLSDMSEYLKYLKNIDEMSPSIRNLAQLFFDGGPGRIFSAFQILSETLKYKDEIYELLPSKIQKKAGDKVSLLRKHLKRGVEIKPVRDLGWRLLLI